MFLRTEQRGIYSFSLRYPLPPRDTELALRTDKLKSDIFGELQSFRAGNLYSIEHYTPELNGMRVFVMLHDESLSPDISPHDSETVYLHIARIREIEPKLLIEFSYALVDGEVYERRVYQDMHEERLKLERVNELSGLLSLLKNTSR